MWIVRYLDEAAEERERLVTQEKIALDRAVDKLRVFGPALPHPHQSDVRGATGLRELRPRAGRSRWRAFYARRGDTFLIGAIGPEAEVDRRGYRRSMRTALTRLAVYAGGTER